MARKRRPTAGQPTKLTEKTIKSMDKMTYIDRPALAAYLQVTTRTIENWITRGRRLMEAQEDGEPIDKNDEIYIKFFQKYTEIREKPFNLFDEHVLTPHTFMDNPRLAFDIMKSLYPDRLGEKSQIEVTQGNPFKDMSDEEIAEKLKQYDIE